MTSFKEEENQKAVCMQVLPWQHPLSSEKGRVKNLQKMMENNTQREKSEPYVFLPNLNEVVEGRLRLRYSTVNDTYYRDYDDTLDPKSTNIKSDWESVLFKYKGVNRYRDDIHDELYLERDGRCDVAYMVWKFDFRSSGLVVDTVQATLEIVKSQNGVVLLSISNEEDEPRENALEEEVTSLKTAEFDGSRVLSIKLKLSVNGPGNFTKLFLQSTVGKKTDCPLDINIRLKRPAFASGRSLVLLGLMFSNEKVNENRRKYRQRKDQRETNKKGHLYVHIHQAKRLPMRNCGMTPDPQIKCKLAIDDKGPSCKTARIRKTLNPTWDEQFVFEGIAEDTLPLAKLQMQVTHDVRSFNRCKKREVLGTLDLQQLSWLDTSFDEDEGRSNSTSNTPMQQLTQDASEITCSRLSGSNRNIQKLMQDDDIIDMMLNGSSPDLSSNAFGDESNENKLNNRHRSVSLTSLQSMAKGSIKDIHESKGESWWMQARRKSLGKILNIGTGKAGKGLSDLKRPSIVLSNSEESVVVLGCEEAPQGECTHGYDDETEEEFSCSSASFLNFNLANEKRRTTLTPLVDSMANNHVEPLAQIQDITKLAGTHLSHLLSYKERWLYCWHPLSFIEP